jgi:hypothetical protein
MAPGLGLVVAFALPTAVLLAHAARYGSWIIDDAGITDAYARNIADGHGIVQQPGADTVEGYSNPLWLLLHVVGHWLGLFDRGTILGAPDYVVFPKALGVGCYLAILGATHAAARAVVRPAWPVTVVAAHTPRRPGRLGHRHDGRLDPARRHRARCGLPGPHTAPRPG